MPYRCADDLTLQLDIISWGKGGTAAENSDTALPSKRSRMFCTSTSSTVELANVPAGQAVCSSAFECRVQTTSMGFSQLQVGDL